MYEINEMNIEGTVIKVELKPPLTQNQKQPKERQDKNVNQEEHIVEIKYENQANEQSENVPQ